MRALVIALSLAASPLAADSPYLVGDALQVEIESNCAAGCITFNQQEARQFHDGIERLLQQREAEAFQRGQADVRERCASLI